jgi:thiosulfate dehydrogenase [quinone] large subunit
MNETKVVQIPEPPLSRFLFGDTRMAWVWLILRLYVGWQWLHAGWGKFNNPAWHGADAGTAISGFFARSLTKAAGAHPDVTGWYAYFISNIALPNATVFSYLITYGEMLIGIALILGAFTGIAAFFGAFMNLNFLFAGTISSNPILFLIQLFLILAWRNAGWLGLDRWLLPWLGTPWQPGRAFRKDSESG